MYENYEQTATSLHLPSRATHREMYKGVEDRILRTLGLQRLEIPAGSKCGRRRRRERKRKKS